MNQGCVTEGKKTKLGYGMEQSTTVSNQDTDVSTWSMAQGYPVASEAGDVILLVCRPNTFPIASKTATEKGGVFEFQ